MAFMAFNRGNGQFHWDPQGARAVSPQAPQAPIGHAPPSMAGEGEKMVNALKEFAQTVGPIVGKEHVRIETGKVDDSILSAKREFEVWKNNYNQENQGKLGINAQADYMAAWDEIAKKYQDQWQGPGHEIFGDTLKQRLFEEGLYAARSGGQWEYEQRELWQASQMQAQEDELMRYAGSNPDDLAGIQLLRQNFKASMAAKNPGVELGARLAKTDEKLAEQMIHGYLSQGRLDDAQKVLDRLKGAGGRGRISALFESGPDAHLAIGYDLNGGTSYGKYQLSSRQGSFREWLDLIEGRDETGKQIAAELRGAGNANTGSCQGAMPEKYKRLAAQYADYFEETQQEYLDKTHYQPAIAAIKSPALRQMIAGDEALQEMVFSTAVQHGGAGAARLLNNVWREGMIRDALIDGLYDMRGTQFQSSTKEVQDSVRNRFAREREAVRAGARGILQPAKIEQFQRQIDHMRKEQTAGYDADIRQRVNSAVAAGMNGEITEAEFTPDEMQRAFGDKSEGAVLTLALAKQQAYDLNALPTMSDAEVDGLLASRKPDANDRFYPEKQRVFEGLQKQAMQIRQARQKDPAAFAATINPKLAQATQAMFQSGFSVESVQDYLKQRDLATQAYGLPAYPLLPEAVAKGAAAAIDSNPALAGMAWRAIRQGGGENGAQLITEIAGKMAGRTLVRSAMTDPQMISLAHKVQTTQGYRENAIKLAQATSPGITLKMVEDCVSLLVQPFAQALQAGGAFGSAQDVLAETTDLTLGLMTERGLPYEEAGRQAFSAVAGDRYEFTNSYAPEIVRYGTPVKRAYVPIPNDLPTNEIEKGMGAILKDFPIDDAFIMPMPGAGKKTMQQLARTDIAANGEWTITPGETGLILRYGGVPVVDKQGKPFQRSWEELAEIGRKKIADFKKEAKPGPGWEFY